MSIATFINMRVHNAEQFRLAPSRATGNTSLYLAFGKVDSWANDLIPDIANTSVATQNGIWYNMIGGKRIFSGDMVHVVPRYDWSANTKYIAYDHMDSTLYNPNTPFYVMTSDYNVYKCIANANSSNSTVEPKSINPTALTETSDGYVWKYMLTVADSDLMRFSTKDYIPVRKLNVDDGSLQWQVQDAVIAGQINSILVTNPGFGYINSNNVSVDITGDGQSIAATATLNTISNTVSSIKLTDYGYDYTYADVTIRDSAGIGQNAAARAIISPIGGHGSDPMYELGSGYLMINTTLKNSEGGVLPLSNEYRQISIIADPLKNDGANVSTNLTFLQTHTLTTIGSGSYNIDENVYQGATYDTAFFKGKIVTWDSANGLVQLINTTGTPTSQSLVGVDSSTARFVTKIVEPDLTRNTGQIFYVNNILPITRSTDQNEDFKIVIKF